MSEPLVDAGFDYVQTVLELRQKFTYDQIAEFCGWENRSSVMQVLHGIVPSHPRGEALYILYFETFGRKPKKYNKCNKIRKNL